jgi:hypothetical protein
MDWSAYIRKLRSIISREFTSSMMNDTKWMEMLGALYELKLRYRLKLVTSESSTDWGFLVGGKGQDYPPHPFVEGCGLSPVVTLEIEWLEIEPFERIQRGALVDDLKINRLEEVEERLTLLSIPYSLRNGVIRVTGHIRRSGVST